MDAEAVDAEAVDAEAMDTEAMDTEAVDTEAVDTEAVDTEAMDTEAMAYYEDWGVAAALGIRRRALVRLREGLTRGEAWDVVNGEVGMSESWCRARGLEPGRLRRAGERGWLTCTVAGYVANPTLLLCREVGQERLIPVHVRRASDFRKGMTIEAVPEFRGYAIAYGWPRKGY